MRFQIRTMQAPSKGAGAFAPTISSSFTAAFNGQNIVTGSPGTTPVPSPRPAALDDGHFGGHYQQPSACSPDVFYPSIYVAHANPTLHFPGRIMCDNTLPVPAKNIGRSAAQTQYRTRVGGRTATSAFRPFTQWPTYGGVKQ